MTDQINFIQYVHNEKTQKALDDIQVRITNYMAVDPAIIGGAIRMHPDDILRKYQQRMESHIMKVLLNQAMNIMALSTPRVIVRDHQPMLIAEEHPCITTVDRA